MHIIKKAGLVATGLLFIIAFVQSVSFNDDLQYAQFQDYFLIVTGNAPFWMHISIGLGALLAVCSIPSEFGPIPKVVFLGLSLAVISTELCRSFQFLNDAAVQADFWKLVGPVPQPPIMVLQVLVIAIVLCIAGVFLPNRTPVKMAPQTA